jgi:3-deoxy-7-phosphoheptulonate synthase
VILRGGRKRTNYAADSVGEVSRRLADAGLAPRVMIDCSHANSLKDHIRQGAVCSDVAGQVANGDLRIIGVMLESNLVAGAQRLSEGQPLVYGQSITDACMGWDETLELLRELAKAAKARALTI